VAIIHAHALGALDQLEDRRQAADLLDQLATSPPPRASTCGECALRRGEMLERRQLVAGCGRWRKRR